MSIEEARQDLLEYAGVVCYDGKGVDVLMQLADAYACSSIREALEKARNSVPSKWKINLDYIEKIDLDHIEMLGGEEV